jgi:DNA-binding CsgD family transcriptional regulator/Tfp pilus assembly protein PilF
LTATGEADEAQGRHARYFVALAEHIDPGVEGAEAGVLLGRLDLDRPNLQSALAWLIEQGEAEQALRLAAAQWRYWRVRGSLREGCDSLERSLALPGFVPPTIRAEAHWKLGVLLFHAGHYGSAREHLEHSIRLYDWCVDSVGLGAALNQLGTVLRLQRKFDLARQHHVRALAIHKSLDDYAGQEMSTAYLGMVALDRGDLSEGRHLLERSFAMAHELGSLRQIGSRSLNLARLELAEGRLPEAQAYVESIRTLAEETNDQLVSEMELEILGGIALSAGARTQAVNYLVQCLQLRLKLGLFLRISDIVEALATAVVSFDAALAVRLLGAAASDREATGVPRLVRDAATYEDTLSLARGALEAGAFASAWRSGKGLTILAAAHEAETALAGLVEVEPDTAAELDRPSRVPNDLGLTSRELEVLQLVAKQLTNREIASELYLSPATVKRHVSNILGKMQVPSRTAAIARARVLGMVEPEP